MERCFAYKIVSFYLIFNDDFQYRHITSSYKRVFLLGIYIETF